MSGVVEIMARAICPECPDGTGRMIGDDGTPYPSGKPHWMAHIDGAITILSALDAAGWAVVRKEPTAEMIEAAHTMIAADGDVADVYRAMLVAAPKITP